MVYLRPQCPPSLPHFVWEEAKQPPSLSIPLPNVEPLLVVKGPMTYGEGKPVRFTATDTGSQVLDSMASERSATANVLGPFM